MRTASAGRRRGPCCRGARARAVRAAPRGRRDPLRLSAFWALPFGRSGGAARRSHDRWSVRDGRCRPADRGGGGAVAPARGPSAPDVSPPPPRPAPHARQRARGACLTMSPRTPSTPKEHAREAQQLASPAADVRQALAGRWRCAGASSSSAGCPLLARDTPRRSAARRRGGRARSLRPRTYPAPEALRPRRPARSGRALPGRTRPPRRSWCQPTGPRVVQAATASRSTREDGPRRAFALRRPGGPVRCDPSSRTGCLVCAGDRPASKGLSPFSGRFPPRSSARRRAGSMLRAERQVLDSSAGRGARGGTPLRIPCDLAVGASSRGSTLNPGPGRCHGCKLARGPLTRSTGRAAPPGRARARLRPRCGWR